MENYAPPARTLVCRRLLADQIPYEQQTRFRKGKTGAAHRDRLFRLPAFLDHPQSRLPVRMSGRRLQVAFPADSGDVPEFRSAVPALCAKGIGNGETIAPPWHHEADFMVEDYAFQERDDAVSRPSNRRLRGPAGIDAARPCFDHGASVS